MLKFPSLRKYLTIKIECNSRPWPSVQRYWFWTPVLRGHWLWNNCLYYGDILSTTDRAVASYWWKYCPLVLLVAHQMWAAAWQNQLSVKVCPAKTEPSLCTQRIANDPRYFHMDSEGFDQTGLMPRLIWVFTRRTDHLFGFVMMQLIWSKTSMQSLQVWVSPGHIFCSNWSWNNFYGHSILTADSSRAVVSYWR